MQEGTQNGNIHYYQQIWNEHIVVDREQAIVGQMCDKPHDKPFALFSFRNILNIKKKGFVISFATCVYM